MDLAQAHWRKSTYSGPETECVEVAFGASEVGVRDSKNSASGVLVLPKPTWRVFLRHA
ncbi:MAG TPA: DUF397 domain-containing protein [Actinophytocola sp.]|jgi:hypothetical protein|uniref:DUF397 domain-containing protein n=1 Tax=Actinophytocola sp. TaxID=1872138 RepID=UPI002DFA491D|nr:DUF397 domain-containing protein [Actinophytocola sp.]